MQNSSAVVDYQAIEAERLNQIQRSITDQLSQTKDLGVNDSLRHVVLHNVATANYDLARREIDRYVAEKSNYPNFQHRVDRYRSYALDLVNGIEAKRNFPGLASLPLAKQQEIYEKVMEHFEDLKANLKQIERHEKEAKLDDIRSTSWVLKALMNSLFFIVAFGFAIDMKNGLAQSFTTVLDVVLSSAVESIFRLIGW
ncbi:MAG: hypothetical protein AB7N80_15650 [Bdellovibrionales bacterium]